MSMSAEFATIPVRHRKTNKLCLKAKVDKKMAEIIKQTGRIYIIDDTDSKPFRYDKKKNKIPLHRDVKGYKRNDGNTVKGFKKDRPIGREDDVEVFDFTDANIIEGEQRIYKSKKKVSSDQSVRWPRTPEVFIQALNNKAEKNSDHAMKKSVEMLEDSDQLRLNRDQVSVGYCEGNPHYDECLTGDFKLTIKRGIRRYFDLWDGEVHTFRLPKPPEEIEKLSSPNLFSDEDEAEAHEIRAAKQQRAKERNETKEERRRRLLAEVENADREDSEETEVRVETVTAEAPVAQTHQAPPVPEVPQAAPAPMQAPPIVRPTNGAKLKMEQDLFNMAFTDPDFTKKLLRNPRVFLTEDLIAELKERGKERGSTATISW